MVLASGKSDNLFWCRSGYKIMRKDDIGFEKIDMYRKGEEKARGTPGRDFIPKCPISPICSIRHGSDSWHYRHIYATSLLRNSHAPTRHAARRSRASTGRARRHSHAPHVTPRTVPRETSYPQVYTQVWISSLPFFGSLFEELPRMFISCSKIRVDIGAGLA